MAKPITNTEINVLICNKPETFYLDSMYIGGNGHGYGLKSDGKVMNFSKLVTVPKVNITPVSIDVPKAVSPEVTGHATHFGTEVPANFQLFDRKYDVIPQVSEISGDGYLYCANTGMSGTTKIIASESGVAAMGFIFGNATTSKPSSFPTGTPSLVDKTSMKLNNSTYYGYPINAMSISYGWYIPCRYRAKLAKSSSWLTIALGTENILMNSLPSGVSSSWDSPRLRDWLEQGDDSSVSEWWRVNYSSIFYTF